MLLKGKLYDKPRKNACRDERRDTRPPALRRVGDMVGQNRLPLARRRSAGDLGRRADGIFRPRSACAVLAAAPEGGDALSLISRRGDNRERSRLRADKAVPLSGGRRDEIQRPLRANKNGARQRRFCRLVHR